MTVKQDLRARNFVAVTRGEATSDGAGVKMTRLIGSGAQPPLDPFLMLDFFGSERAGDYIGGFPDHPHRGFETVTYMLAGRMRHSDNHGHSGVVEAGDVQWMKAGRGLIHSEMPEQDHGLMRGFQLWINLPAAEKMSPPAYQEFKAAQIPVEEREGARVKVIAGVGASGAVGPVRAPHVDAVYFDIELAPGAQLPAGDAGGPSGLFRALRGLGFRARSGGREGDRLARANYAWAGRGSGPDRRRAGRARPAARGTAVARADRLERPLRDEQPRRADPGL